VEEEEQTASATAGRSSVAVAVVETQLVAQLVLVEAFASCDFVHKSFALLP